MSLPNLSLRIIKKEDKFGLLALYKALTQEGNDIWSYPFEVNETYIEDFIRKSLKSGLGFVVEDKVGQLIGTIHAHMQDVFVGRYILTGLGIAVHPQYQTKRITKLLFRYFLDKIKIARPDILRVELLVRESNAAAIKIYQKLGFVQEGKLIDQAYTREMELHSVIAMAWRNPNFRKMAFSLPSRKHQLALLQVAKEDLPSLSLLARKIYAQHFLYLWDDNGAWYRKNAFSIEKLSKEIQESGAKWFLIFRLGEAVGFLKIIDQKGSEGRDPNAFKLERIYMLAEAQGEGIGQTLMDYVIQSARQLGRTYICLDVMDTSFNPIRFYERNGFIRVGTHELDLPHVIDRYKGMFKMKKEL